MENILIIKLAAIGDVLRTTSILEGLKEKYPNCKISWLTKPEAYPILKNNPLIDTIILSEKVPQSDQNLKKSFDLIISLDEDPEICRTISTIPHKKLIGAFFKDNNVNYTEDSREWFDMGLASRFGKEKADILKKENKKTYQEIICDILNINKGNLILNLDKESKKFAENFAKKNNLSDSDTIIGLNTGAGKRWPLKKLSIEKTANLASTLSKELNVKILLFGGPEEKERNSRILALANQHIIDTDCSNSLIEFSALINLCDLVITSDSLAMHIAVALNKKLIAFFGPTSSCEIDIYGNGEKISADIECFCCYKKECSKTPSCMDKISVESIICSAKELLSQK